MEQLKGKTVFLRVLAITDLEVLLRIENNTAFWSLSDVTNPFSEQMMLQYLESAQLDIQEVKQQRFAICETESKEIIGFVELFDFDSLHKRVGVGIIIEETAKRNKGYGAEALGLLLKYVKEQLALHQVYANVLEDNMPSVALFEKCDFQRVGLKKEWRCIEGVFKNEILYQKII